MSSSDNDNPSIPLSEWCEARYMGVNRGYGVVALKDIAEGTTILTDNALIGINEADTLSRAAQREIKRQYEASSAEQQQRFDALHCFISEEDRIEIELKSLQIMDDSPIRATYLRDYERVHTFATNCFDIATSNTQAALFLNASRFNHACKPSAEYDVRLPLGAGADVAKATWEAYAVLPIAEGDEITLNYSFRNKQRDERQRSLLETWGFTCTCSVCDLDGADGGASSRNFDADLRNLDSDEAEWARTKYVSRWFSNDDVIERLERLGIRIGLARNVGNQEILWKSTQEEGYRDTWETYLDEARFKVCHRSMDPTEQADGTWDREVMEELEQRKPNPEEVYTESEGGSSEGTEEDFNWSSDEV
ncbi:hypothetical protein PG993_011425 [Apiospora rasikravindrae]|uniref:SET domain-containing protein n=1 Tax=Apiospora rasikravindrae TaxID=990691 RepID=A0ABR1SG00_9PEZI